MMARVTFDDVVRDLEEPHTWLLHVEAEFDTGEDEPFSVPFTVRALGCEPPLEDGTRARMLSEAMVELFDVIAEVHGLEPEIGGEDGCPH